MKIIIAIILVGVFVVWGFNYGIQKQEISECMVWQEYAHEFETFYLTKWQSQQCARYNINVPSYPEQNHNNYFIQES
jgi:hypothetical protein